MRKGKSISHWVLACGIPCLPWKSGEWRYLTDLLLRLLGDELFNRNQHGECCQPRSSISFNTISALAEDSLGIPVIATEADLLSFPEHRKAALLAAAVCIRRSSNLRSRDIKDALLPEVDVLDPVRTCDSVLLTCAACSDEVLLIERIVINKMIFHRRCFKCSQCSEVLLFDAYRYVEGTNQFECIKHWPDSVLSMSKSKCITKEKPSLPPKPKFLRCVSQETAKAVLSLGSGDMKAVGTFENNNEAMKVLPTEIRNVSVESSFLSASEKSDSKVLDTEDLVKRVNENILYGSTSTGNFEEEKKQAVIVPDDSSACPVPPPRLKRRSVQIVSAETRSDVLTPLPLPRSHCRSLGKGALLNDADHSTSHSYDRETGTETTETNSYPDALNPFGSSDEESSEEFETCDGFSNPFETSSEDDVRDLSTTAFRGSHNSILSASDDAKLRKSVMGLSVRPKSVPPPPPKPPRLSLDTSKSASQAVLFPRGQKKFPAPLPPVPVKREIVFDESNGQRSFSTEYLLMKIRNLSENISACESLYRSREVEVMDAIKQGDEWLKSKCTKKWIFCISQRCGLIRLQRAYVHLWLKKFLNDVHSEAEFRIRYLEEDGNSDPRRLAELVELLKDVVDRKSKIAESKFSANSVIETEEQWELRGSITTKPSIDAQKSLKLRVEKYCKRK